ncbi:MAG: S-layer homology domain-containing protein [Clostridiales bacterium]|nr:S-layer homology domain-containing protein [Clostridiales bacterium]
MQGKVAAVMAAVTAVSAIMPIQVYAASNNQDYRRRVVGIAGIILNTSTEMSRTVTRAEFANYLVKASTYRDYLPVSGKVAVYNDVPSTHEYASSIRIAAKENWLNGYLGGLFKPDQAITLKEASRGIMALLGYEDSDFEGDIVGSRMSLFYELELNEDLDRQPTEVLTKDDCVNLFYNLLKTEMKTGTVYGTVLGCTVNSDGEINPMGLADTNLSGPKLIEKGGVLGNYIPFNVQEASIFVNGDASSYTALRSYVQSNYVVVYYNQTARTIWAYIADEDVQTGRCAIRGTIENIYYSSTEVMTPSYVVLSGDSEEYQLDSTEMQFAFSVYGSLRVGDIVTLICEKTVDSNDNATYSIVDYIAD